MYLDNASTTPLTKEVKETILKWLDFFGNPSSLHEEGRIVRDRIYEAREDIARFIGGEPESIIFTSSGSAANNLVIHGLSDEYMYLYTPTCHKSMRMVCESKPYHIVLRMDTDGTINKEWLEFVVQKWSKKKKIILCYELVNSEIGVLQDAEYLHDLIHDNYGIVVADTTAYIPHFKLDIRNLKADFVTFSAHKLGALKGIGIVYKNCSLELKPLIYGAQEQGLFGGTENVIGIVALQAACNNYIYEEFNNIGILHRYMSDCISSIPDSYEVVGKSEAKIPYVSMYCFKNVQGEQLAYLLDEEGYQVSLGSACNSFSPELSKTLLAIKMPQVEIPCCIRVSFSGKETVEEINHFIDVLKFNVEKLRIL